MRLRLTTDTAVAGIDSTTLCVHDLLIEHDTTYGFSSPATGLSLCSSIGWRWDEEVGLFLAKSFEGDTMSWKTIYDL